MFRTNKTASLLLSLLLASGVWTAMTPRAAAAPDTRELKAREDFAAGRYEVALELFARLYAETLHPIYLRNIGRCYQNLGQPDRAITSFRDYQHKAKGMSADERAEIEGYIKEMQDLKKQRESAPAPAVVTPIPAAPPPSEAPPPAVAVTADLRTSPPPQAQSSPIYARWWFWAIVAGVVVAGVGGAAAAGAFTHTTDASCEGGFSCPK